MVIIIIIFECILLFYIIYTLYSIIKAVKRKNEEGPVVLIFIFILALSMVLDILVERQILKTALFANAIGLFIFLFAQYFLLGRRFARDYKEKIQAKNNLEDLNINLEKKVKQRTEELMASNSELEAMNEQLVMARDALWGEMKVAQKIQTILLPEKPVIPGFKIGAYTKPADEVGGDYYDIINTADRNWLIIGDVSGHGLPAGLVMMMVQTSIHTAIEQNPDLEPAKLLSIINKTIKKNIEKLNEKKYMTITIFAVHQHGKFYFSGLHQNILIYRKNSRKVDSIATNGAWIGIFDNIESLTEDNELFMKQGDTMLLFTDGITEAWVRGSIRGKRDSETDMFGETKLIELIQKNGEGSTEEIIQSILAALKGYDVDDDVTMLILKKT